VEMGHAVETCPCSVIGWTFGPGVDPNSRDFAFFLRQTTLFQQADAIQSSKLQIAVPPKLDTELHELH
jgi:hypothetical protein